MFQFSTILQHLPFFSYNQMQHLLVPKSYPQYLSAKDKLLVNANNNDNMKMNGTPKIWHFSNVFADSSSKWLWERSLCKGIRHQYRQQACICWGSGSSSSMGKFKATLLLQTLSLIIPTSCLLYPFSFLNSLSIMILERKKNTCLKLVSGIWWTRLVNV